MSDLSYPALTGSGDAMAWQGAGYRPRSVSAAVLIALLRWTDLLLLVAACVLATPAGLRQGSPAGGMYLAASIVGLALAAVCSQRLGVYRVHSLRSVRSQCGKWIVLLAAVAAAAAAAFAFLGAPSETIMRWPTTFAVFGAGLILLPRVVLAPLIRTGLSAGRLEKRVAVIGANPLGLAVVEAIVGDPQSGHSLAGVFDDDGQPGSALPGTLQLAGGVADLVALSRRERIDAIVIACSAPAKIDLICAQLRSIVAEICIASQLPPTIGRRLPVSRLGNTALMTVMPRALTDWEMVQKAIFDRVFGVVLLILLSPLLLIVALAIKFDSRGTVLFCQPRVGFNNVPFTLFKFRTMHTEMSDLLADRQTSRGDARVTRIGKTLRSLSLDELAQLLNVVRGEMSIVGPRPHAPNTRAGGHKLHEAVAEYAERHRVKPGITGWAQVNGSRGQLETVEDIRRRVSLDLEYIQSWSLWLDVRIVFLTIRREIFSKRAY